MAATFSSSELARSTFAAAQQNPFMVPEAAVSAHEVTEPEVDLGALEDTTAQILEVRVRWGEQVLCVRHLEQGSFTLGEDSELHIPAEILGAESYEIARCTNGIPEVRVPQSAVAWGEVGVLGEWTSLRGDVGFELGAFTIECGLVKRGHKPAGSWWASITESASRHVGLSLFLHGALIASLAYFMPSLGNDDAEAMGRDQILMMQKYLDAAAEIDREMKEQGEQAAEAGDVGERAAGEAGAMGSTTAPPANARWAKQGPADNPNPALSRAEMRAEVSSSAMIGMVAALAGDPNAPSSPWAELAQGRDAISANGKMWGDSIGDAFGMGGLELAGTGIGGGGDGKGVGLGDIDFGHGAGHVPGTGGMGNCRGDNCGWGSSSGLTRNGYKPHKISMRATNTVVNGRLPADAIQRVVRQNFGRFRTCYEAALRTNPTLSGRIATKFVIDRSGAVSMAQDGGSDMPDRSVVSCVVRNFSNLSFPAPDGGIVTVVYPIHFTPGE